MLTLDSDRSKVLLSDQLCLANSYLDYIQHFIHRHHPHCYHRIKSIILVWIVIPDGGRKNKKKTILANALDGLILCPSLLVLFVLGSHGGEHNFFQRSDVGLLGLLKTTITWELMSSGAGPEPMAMCGGSLKAQFPCLKQKTINTKRHWCLISSREHHGMRLKLIRWLKTHLGWWISCSASTIHILVFPGCIFLMNHISLNPCLNVHLWTISPKENIKWANKRSPINSIIYKKV